VRRILTFDDRQKILERDGYVCAYCLAEATEVDHIIPWSWSHDDNENNLVAACEDCNGIAADKVFESLKEKYNYIQEVRQGRKWKRRLSKSDLSTCIHCHKTYKPRINGSTIFLCSECVEKGWLED
jgi:hypothetical protein